VGIGFRPAFRIQKEKKEVQISLASFTLTVSFSILDFFYLLDQDYVWGVAFFFVAGLFR